MASWQNYIDERPQHTVTGTLMVYNDLWSPQLQNRRDILVYLPEAASNTACPVIYMQDGQNLFDAHTSYAGEWHVDESLRLLESEGLSTIVVGIPNMGVERTAEYSPFRHPRMGGGRGHAYLDFVTQTVKPLVDASFNTLPDRLNTGILGSSMGGLISLYALFSHASTFGFAGVMSPSLWFGRSAIFDYIRRASFTHGKIYLDTGTHEGRAAQSIRSAAAEMHTLLINKGYEDGRDLLYVEESGGRHEEAAWARRLPQALRFLLKHRQI